jgi:hypothetical protein
LSVKQWESSEQPVPLYVMSAMHLSEAVCQNCDVESHWQVPLWHVRPKSTRQVVLAAQAVLFLVLSTHVIVTGSKYLAVEHWHWPFTHVIVPRHSSVLAHASYSAFFELHSSVVVL